jgi:hypothetical protein
MRQQLTIRGSNVRFITTVTFEAEGGKTMPLHPMSKARGPFVV